MRFVSVNCNVREAVRRPKDGYKQCFRNPEIGKNIYGPENHGKLHRGGAF